VAELYAQVTTLKTLKSAGPVVRGLEKRWGEMNDKVAQQTTAIVDLQEKLTMARVALQTGLAELTLPDTPGAASHPASGAPAR
jgi:hypothetical protein